MRLHAEAHGACARVRAPAALTPETVRARVSTGVDDRKLRQDAQELRRVFHHLSPPAREPGADRLLPAGRLRDALALLGVRVDEQEAADFLRTAGGGAPAGLSLDDFAAAAERPWAGEAWARSLPLAELLSDALPHCEGCPRLLAIGSLTPEEASAIADGLREGLCRLLLERVAALRGALGAAPGPPGNRKFEVAEMSAGRVGDFHAGLKKRVGAAPERGMAHALAVSRGPSAPSFTAPPPPPVCRVSDRSFDASDASFPRAAPLVPGPEPRVLGRHVPLELRGGDEAGALQAAGVRLDLHNHELRGGNRPAARVGARGGGREGGGGRGACGGLGLRKGRQAAPQRRQPHAAGSDRHGGTEEGGGHRRRAVHRTHGADPPP